MVNSENSITLHLQGKTLVANAGDNLLDALLKQCVPLPYGCRAGSCRSCEIVEACSGQVLLACQTILNSDIELEHVSSTPQVSMQLQVQERIQTVNTKITAFVFFGAFTHYFLQRIHLYKKSTDTEKTLVYTTRVLSDSNETLNIDLPCEVLNFLFGDSSKLSTEEWFIQDASVSSLTPYLFRDLPLDSAPLYLIVNTDQFAVVERMLDKLLTHLRDLTQAPISILTVNDDSFVDVQQADLADQREAKINFIIEKHSKVAASFLTRMNEQSIVDELSIWVAEQKKQNFMFLRASFVVIADSTMCQEVLQQLAIIGVNKQRIHLFDC